VQGCTSLRLVSSAIVLWNMTNEFVNTSGHVSCFFLARFLKKWSLKSKLFKNKISNWICHCGNNAFLDLKEVMFFWTFRCRFQNWYRNRKTTLTIHLQRRFQRHLSAAGHNKSAWKGKNGFQVLSKLTHTGTGTDTGTDTGTQHTRKSTECNVALPSLLPLELSGVLLLHVVGAFKSARAQSTTFPFYG